MVQDVKTGSNTQTFGAVHLPDLPTSLGWLAQSIAQPNSSTHASSFCWGPVTCGTLARGCEHPITFPEQEVGLVAGAERVWATVSYGIERGWMIKRRGGWSIAGSSPTHSRPTLDFLTQRRPPRKQSKYKQVETSGKPWRAELNERVCQE